MDVLLEEEYKLMILGEFDENQINYKFTEM
jgi:hypothetical protein